MKLFDIHNSGQRLFVVLMVIISLLWLAGDSWRQALEYNRAEIADGDIWRIISGHLVHSNGWHLLLNISSLGLIGLLFGSQLNARLWAVAFVFCGLVVSGAYWFISPEYNSYVGLSAALYGVIIIGALEDLQENPWIAAALLLIVTGRVIWQQFDGASPELAELVESRVAIESHLYGMLAGYFYALLLWISRRPGKAV